MALKFITDEAFKISARDKKVLVRFDFNVPMDKNDSTKIADTTRIDEALETINAILELKPKKLILMSHFGRPKGKIESPSQSLPAVDLSLLEPGSMADFIMN